jgi:hypothetical protein
MDKFTIKEIEESLRAILSPLAPIDAKKEAHIENTEAYTVSLYLVNEEIFKEILYLDQRVRSYFTDEKKPPKDPFRNFAKIIGSEKIYKYSIKAKHIYKDVIDRDKILEAIPATLNAYKAAETERLTTLMEKEEWSDESRRKAFKELEERFINEERALDELQKHWEEYDVVMSNYEARHIYPVLYYTTTKGKSTHTMLRRDIPNIVLYEEDKERASARSNKKMEKIIKEYEKTCNILYFKKKEQ